MDSAPDSASTPSVVSLRPAVLGDMAAVQHIYAHHVLTGYASFEETPPDAAEVTRRWTATVDAGLPYVCAVEKDQVLGYAYAGPYRPRSAYRFCVEDSIYLAPGATGRGIGRALLNHLIARCTEIGKRQMIAVIGDSANLASIELHRACGFRLVGTFASIGFKHGRWVDSVLMQRQLGAGADSLPG
jgi:L-amino acid N-acyltransferase YncA